MQIRLHTVTGHSYKSDSVSLADARAAFTGTDLAFYETMTKVVNMMGSLGSLDTVSIQVNGTDRHFNANHVLWVEVDWEGETLEEPEPTGYEARRRDAIRRAGRL